MALKISPGKWGKTTPKKTKESRVPSQNQENRGLGIRLLDANLSAEKIVLRQT